LKKVNAGNNLQPVDRGSARGSSRNGRRPPTQKPINLKKQRKKKKRHQATMEGDCFLWAKAALAKKVVFSSGEKQLVTRGGKRTKGTKSRRKDTRPWEKRVEVQRHPTMGRQRQLFGEKKKEISKKTGN